MRIILKILIFCFAFPHKTDAYLDPGSGSLFIQLVIGIVLGVLYLVKLYWNKITKIITSIFNKKNAKEK